MKTLKWIQHQIAHFFGWNYGNSEAWYEDGELMGGFRCKGCGKLQSKHKVRRISDDD
jgi:hypothetical protein